MSGSRNRDQYVFRYLIIMVQKQTKTTTKSIDGEEGHWNIDEELKKKERKGYNLKIYVSHLLFRNVS